MGSVAKKKPTSDIIFGASVASSSASAGRVAPPIPPPNSARVYSSIDFAWGPFLFPFSFTPLVPPWHSSSAEEVAEARARKVTHHIVFRHLHFDRSLWLPFR